jgi:sulfate adenylyltransferase subunit 2
VLLHLAVGVKLIVHVNEDGLRRGIDPIAAGSALHTHVTKTEALKQALDVHGFRNTARSIARLYDALHYPESREFDAAIGGARRDEEKSRAKERIFSFRGRGPVRDPRRQRLELWRLFNIRIAAGESVRAFPLSNWTKIDVWRYILAEKIPVVPLYFAAERPVVRRSGTLIVVDDERLPLKPGEILQLRRVRFRALGCYPLTGAIESDADTVDAIVSEMLQSSLSERQGRLIDGDAGASMESRKREGYFR